MTYRSRVGTFYVLLDRSSVHHPLGGRRHRDTEETPGEAVRTGGVAVAVEFLHPVFLSRNIQLIFSFVSELRFDKKLCIFTNLNCRTMTDRLKAIDFFCGGGGMTCGLRQAGVDVIAGVDFAEECRETYEFNNQGSRFICADIKKLEEDILEKDYGVSKNDDKLIFVGCSPCQYYSIIHTQKDKSKASKDLLREFMRFVSYYNPGFVLVENVPGLLSKEDSVYPEFRAFLVEKGYRVADKVVDMSYYGVPQTRRRFSLVASRLDIDVRLPEKDSKQKLLREVIGADKGFPSIPAGHIDDSSFMHTTTALSEKNLKRVRRVPHDGGSRLAWKDDPELQLKCYVGKDHSFRDVYGRLRWNAPSATITTNFVNTSSGRFSHPEEDRGLSIREGATLQTFPKDYVFKAKTIRANARIIGNAVPPEYGRRLGELLYSLYAQKYGTV